MLDEVHRGCGEVVRRGVRDGLSLLVRCCGLKLHRVAQEKERKKCQTQAQHLAVACTVCAMTYPDN